MGFWIGLRWESGIYKWRDGSNISWTNWAGNGNNTHENNTDCVLGNVKQGNIEWNKEDCNKFHPFICEGDLQSTITPDATTEGPQTTTDFPGDFRPRNTFFDSINHTKF